MMKRFLFFVVGLFVVFLAVSYWATNALALDPDNIPSEITTILSNTDDIATNISELNKLSENTTDMLIKEWALYFSAYLNATSFDDTEHTLEAIRLYTQLAEEFQNADAHESIGDIYYFGRNVPIDYEKAAKWYSSYVELEQDPDILERYAALIASGAGGLKQDKLLAWYWFNQAYDKNKFVPAWFGAYFTFLNLRSTEIFRAKQYLRTKNKDTLFEHYNLTE